jgi:NTP pyrophosphatase (non-canonical NTP hydrolase)
MRELQRIVTEAADRLSLHATAPTMLLDLQVRLGGLAAEVVHATENGRRPYRPTANWEPALGDLAFALINLADQTGVDLDRAVRIAVDRLYRSGLAQQRHTEASWPFG